MREIVGATADRWFTTQARALRHVDARMEPLALRFAAMNERPMLPQDDAPPPAGWRAPAWLRGPFEAIGEVQAAPDRLLLYRAALLHSGAITGIGADAADPRRGRLTGNLFLQCRAAA